mgnify:CR=1 FL=1
MSPVMTPVTGEPLLLVAGGVSAARGLLLELLHAARSSDDSANAKVSLACMVRVLTAIGDFSDVPVS